MTRSTGPRRARNSGRRGVRAEAASARELAQAHSELVGFLESAPEGVRNWAQAQIAAIGDARDALSAGPEPRRTSSLRRIAVFALTLGLIAAVVVGVYNMGGGGQAQSRSNEAGASEQRGLSPAQRARAGQLMQRLKSRPRDGATLVALGNLFFQAHEYNRAGGWMKQAVAVDPNNVTARLALGAAEFNIGDPGDARREWLRVVAVDPKNIEAFYDLGFLYVSRQPPDLADARKTWGRVIALAPKSSVAKTVAMHLKGLEKK